MQLLKVWTTNKIDVLKQRHGYKKVSYMHHSDFNYSAKNHNFEIKIRY